MDGGDAGAVVRVVVMFAVIWWMYDGYAWLTNAIATDRVRNRLLLIGGMGGFLVVALAIPHADGGQARLRGRLPRRRPSARRDVRRGSVRLGGGRDLRLVPFNLVAAGLVLVGGVLGGDAQWAMGGRWARLGHAVAHERGGLPDLGVRTSSSATGSS